MVAAAKTAPRAGEAAEMARPYAEKMEAVMGGLAQSVGQSETAPRPSGRQPGRMMCTCWW